MLDPHKLMRLQLPRRRQAYGARDAILYALGVGYGLDPCDDRQLRFVDETKLVAAPTLACVLASPGFWMRDLDTGIDWEKVVHGEQSMRLHRPLAAAGEVESRSRVIDVVDKGPAKGAVVRTETTLHDAASGAIAATLESAAFCRGDGGFSGAAATETRRAEMAAPRAPDITVELPTHPQQALIYRLSGDLNPLHADPAVARAAGFPRPILHGLATFGVAGHALMAALCGYEPSRVLSLSARFSAPVYPGETVAVDIWRDAPGEASFAARVPARVAVLSAGRFTYSP